MQKLQVVGVTRRQSNVGVTKEGTKVDRLYVVVSFDPNSGVYNMFKTCLVESNTNNVLAVDKSVRKSVSNMELTNMLNAM